MLALAVLALACAKKWFVQVRWPDWPEPLNLYCVVALKSGESKSPAFAAATRPVHNFAMEDRKRLEPEIKIATARYDVASRRIDQLKNRAAKEVDGAALERLMKEVETAVLEQATIQIPVPLRLILDDVTAESLEQVMRQQGGRIAIMSDEGGPFELMGGRYNDNIPNIDIYLKGHSGSSTAIDRVGRQGGSIRNPALTIGLAIQPDVIETLQAKKGFRGRGLLARFLWSIPESCVGTRTADSPAMPESIRVAYENAVLNMLAVPVERDQEGEMVSRRIDVARDAYALIVELKARIEPTLGLSGDLETIADWANKLGGTVARIAGLLHLADRAHEPERHMDPISREEMQRALVIADYLLAHARRAFDKMSADPTARDARRILEWIQRNGIRKFTGRDVYLANRAWFKAPADMGPGLELLIDHDAIRRRPEPPRAGPGRPPTPTFDVNPGVHEQNAQNTQNPTTTAAPRHSEHSEQGPEPLESDSVTPIRPSGDGAKGDR